MTIVFTHDLHSHIDPFPLNGDSVGGFARISTVINNFRDNNDNVIVLDGGDFSMGSYIKHYLKARHRNIVF